MFVTIAAPILTIGCGRSLPPGAAAPAASAAVPFMDLDLSACLAAGAVRGQCPGYVLRSLDSMVEECSRVGGTLQAGAEPRAWSLDVDADGKAEVIIDITENFGCSAAPSLFSCGSLGCPYALYAERNGEWVMLGAIDASDAPGLEVLPATQGPPAVELRGGCVGRRPCDEMAHYSWSGSDYRRTWVEFRGQAVDWAPDGLWELDRDTPVLAEPVAAAEVIGRYPADTSVVVLGDARGAPYKFVSPCNACQSGFVDAASLKKGA